MSEPGYQRKTGWDGGVSSASWASYRPYISLAPASAPRAPVWLFRSPHHCCRGFVMRTS